MSSNPVIDLPQEEIERRKRSRILRRVTSREAQDEEALRYWLSCTPDARVLASLELTELAYTSKGYNANHLGRPERTLTRVEREWC